MLKSLRVLHGLQKLACRTSVGEKIFSVLFDNIQKSVDELCRNPSQALTSGKHWTITSNLQPLQGLARYVTYSENTSLRKKIRPYLSSVTLSNR